MTDPQTMAEALLAAERERTPIAPFSRRNPFLDASVGYAAQEILVAHKRAEGKQVIGIKLGMTSKVKRDTLGIREPVYGRITEDMLVPPGESITVAELIHPRAEPELAVVVGRPIPSGAGVADVLACIEAVYPAIEVFDSRYGEPFRLVDSIADNVGAARVVLGRRPRKLDELAGLHVLGCVFGFPDGFDTAAGGPWRARTGGHELVLERRHLGGPADEGVTPLGDGHDGTHLRPRRSSAITGPAGPSQSLLGETAAEPGLPG